MRYTLLVIGHLSLVDWEIRELGYSHLSLVWPIEMLISKVNRQSCNWQIKKPKKPPQLLRMALLKLVFMCVLLLHESVRGLYGSSATIRIYIVGYVHNEFRIIIGIVGAIHHSGSCVKVHIVATATYQVVLEWSDYFVTNQLNEESTRETTIFEIVRFKLTGQWIII